MTRNFGGRQPELYHAALRYFCTRLTYFRSTTAVLQFFPADLAFFAFLFDDSYQGQSRFFEFHLSQRLLFCFFYDLMYGNRRFRGSARLLLLSSFATHLLQANYDIRTIQTLLGHADVRTTMIYIHCVPSKTLKEMKSPLDF